MRNYSPNYIGLIKAAGVSDFVRNALSGITDQTSNQNPQLDIRQTQTPQIKQPTVLQASGTYTATPNLGYTTIAQKYQQWYQDRVKDYKREVQHQERQQENIQDARRLTAENNEKAQRDKQIIDQQRIEAEQARYGR